MTNGVGEIGRLSTPSDLGVRKQLALLPGGRNAEIDYIAAGTTPY